MPKSILNSRAVTLVEMMIVITVAAILAAVGYSSYQASQQYARFYGVVTDTMEQIRSARNLAINSQLIEGKNPEYYNVVLDNTGGISATVNGHAEDNSNKEISTYQSTSKYSLLPVTINWPLTIQFSPPFGDTFIKDTAVSDFVKATIRLTDGKFCNDISINKISGLISVESSSSCP